MFLVCALSSSWFLLLQFLDHIKNQFKIIFLITDYLYIISCCFKHIASFRKKCYIHLLCFQSLNAVFTQSLPIYWYLVLVRNLRFLLTGNLQVLQFRFTSVNQTTFVKVQSHRYYLHLASRLKINLVKSRKTNTQSRFQFVLFFCDSLGRPPSRTTNLVQFFQNNQYLVKVATYALINHKALFCN